MQTSAGVSTVARRVLSVKVRSGARELTTHAVASPSACGDRAIHRADDVEVMWRVVDGGLWHSITFNCLRATISTVAQRIYQKS